MKQVRATSLLAVIALLAALLGNYGTAHAQEPRDVLQPSALQGAPACPPDVLFGCRISGAWPYGWWLDSTSPNTSAVALWGRVIASTPGTSAAGVRGQVTSTTTANGYGVWGSHAGSGTGVYGYALAGNGVFGQSTNLRGVGVYGTSAAGTGVYGLHEDTTGTAPGVRGQTSSTSANAAGVLGVINTSTAGVDSAGVRGVNSGTGTVGYGVWGSHAGRGTGVYGYAPGGPGVQGASGSSIGVYGTSNSGYAGYFVGPVHVTGTLSKAGGSFKIDHPLDPANQYLSHSFVESPDMMNVYNGNVVLDEKGDAVVELAAVVPAPQEQLALPDLPATAEGGT
jgi:hypothetical protein